MEVTKTHAVAAASWSAGTGSTWRNNVVGQVQFMMCSLDSAISVTSISSEPNEHSS